MVFIKKKMKNRARYVVAHTILRRIPFFYFSEIKIGPLKRILVRGAKGLCAHIGVGICVGQKKIDYFYMVQFNSLQHRLYSELHKNVK